MVQLKVGLVGKLLVGLGLAKVGGLAKMVVVKLGEEGLVGGLGEHSLLIEDGQDTHGLKHKWCILSTLLMKCTLKLRY